jgi:hypothetical protein
MALGMTLYQANLYLNHLRNGTTMTKPAAIYVKLHTGDPGASGTANAATETTRQQLVSASTITTGSLANTAAIQWLNVSTSETYTHFSIWDASTAGNCWQTGNIDPDVAVVSGNTFTIAIGGITISPTLAA